MSTMLSLRLSILLSLIGGFSANSCNVNVKLQQELNNEGFHRNLTYKVTFVDQNEASLYKGCYVGLDQVLPAGVFASPDELGDLLRMNKMTAVPKNRVNTELPAEDSQPSGVFVMGQVTAGEVNLWLPVHARYHRAVKGGGLYVNKIVSARVLMRCPRRTFDDCEPRRSQLTFLCAGGGRELCTWTEISTVISPPSPLELAVPVGDLHHYGVVAPTTAGVVVILSLYLLKTLHQYKLKIKKR